MTEYVPFKLDDDSGSMVLIEVDCGEDGLRTLRGDHPVAKAISQVGEQAKVSLSAAMENIKAGAAVVLSKLKEIEITERPSTIELAFGIKLDASAGAIVAQTGAEVNYTVKITWQTAQPKERAPFPRKTRKRSLTR